MIDHRDLCSPLPFPSLSVSPSIPYDRLPIRSSYDGGEVGVSREPTEVQMGAGGGMGVEGAC